MVQQWSYYVHSDPMHTCSAILQVGIQTRNIPLQMLYGIMHLTCLATNIQLSAIAAGFSFMLYTLNVAKFHADMSILIIKVYDGKGHKLEQWKELA